MRTTIAARIALSPLTLSLALAGCATSQTAMFKPNPASAAEARAEERAAQHYAASQADLQKGDVGGALVHAEKAVEHSPRDAGYRMLLGDLYLKSGRFLSAETAFSDVLTLHPDNHRARFNLALAQIALGKRHAALVQLDRLAETAAPADIGLAYALAGQPERAVAMLEPAARQPNADARLRQNLALAFALSGDWRRARSAAAQDLSPADLAPRMEQWAAFVQPQASYDQVASLLGVSPAEDAGQPVRLALAPEPVPQAAVAEAPTVPVPAATPSETESYAEAAQALTTPQPAVVQTTALPASAPVAAFPAEASAQKAPLAIGRYVVQLGAYESARLAEQSWPAVQRRYGLDGATPVSGRVKLATGTFYRLSVGGFASETEAARACGTIKAKGGACFVRGVMGDVPMVRLASRDPR